MFIPVREERGGGPGIQRHGASSSAPFKVNQKLQQKGKKSWGQRAKPRDAGFWKGDWDEAMGGEL